MHKIAVKNWFEKFSKSCDFSRPIDRTELINTLTSKQNNYLKNSLHNIPIDDLIKLNYFREDKNRIYITKKGQVILEILKYEKLIIKNNQLLQKLQDQIFYIKNIKGDKNYYKITEGDNFIIMEEELNKTHNNIIKTKSYLAKKIDNLYLKLDYIDSINLIYQANDFINSIRDKEVNY